MLHAAVVLGKEYRYWNGKPLLSFEAKMTALGAGQMFNAGFLSKLIFSGGQTAGPDHPSEAEAMAEYCMRHCKIPAEAIILEKESFDTIENARRVKVIVAKRKFTVLRLITRDYHLVRAEGIFRREGVSTSPLSAEGAFADRSPRHRALAHAYTHSFYYRLVRVKEFLLRLQLAIDPEVRLQRFITRRMRFAK